MAGGTDLLQLWKAGVIAPEGVVDISRLPLDGIEFADSQLSLGALARLSDVAIHPDVTRDHPLIAEAISGAQLSIGRPYFDRVEVPLGLALLFLMGIGPQLPWHGASRATLERQFTIPIAAAAAGAIVAALVGLGSPFAVLTYALAFFVAATVAQEFARGMQARHTLHGEGRALAFVNLLRRSGRRYGGYIVHLGIVVIAVAVATSQAGTVQVEKTLSPGESVFST